MIKENLGVKYYTFDIYEKYKFMKGIFSTRVGGVSTGKQESLNLGFSKEENRENVIENYKRLTKASGTSFDSITFSYQVHETNVMVIDDKNIGNGMSKENEFISVDGLITDKKGIALTTFYADCVPLYFLEPNKKIIGISHSGWRGTVDNMVKATIDKMVEEYNINPKDLVCGIGPSIMDCCFEVDYPVAKEFYDRFEFSKDYIKKDNRDKYFIDLQNINKKLMIIAGVNPDNIEISGMCTYCHSELFYSHRRMGTDRGSMVGIIELLED